MIETEEYLMIRDLHTQGLNISQISRKTGHDRKTVRTHLNSNSIPETKERVKKESKLDSFKEYIIKKLNEAPFTASRLFREVKEMGYNPSFPLKN